jgi:hypothetical protein
MEYVKISGTDIRCSRRPRLLGVGAGSGAGAMSANHRHYFRLSEGINLMDTAASTASGGRRVWGKRSPSMGEIKS